MRTEIIYGYRDTYLEDSLIPSLFSKIVIISLSLEPTNFPAMDSRSDFIALGMCFLLQNKP